MTETSSTSEIFTEPSECVEVNIVMISHVVEYRHHFSIFDNTFIGKKLYKNSILNIYLLLSGFELSSASIRFPRPCALNETYMVCLVLNNLIFIDYIFVLGSER